MTKIFVLLCFVIAGVTCDCEKSILPDLTYRLSGNHLEWPCESTKNIYTSTGRYTPRNMIATRAQIYKDTALIAAPRYKSGVPITLGVINMKKGSCSAPIKPFPCWSLQEEGNCNALQSVVDLFIDDQVSYIVVYYVVLCALVSISVGLFEIVD